jgi:GDPmannose 4,6-dehydratase
MRRALITGITGQDGSYLAEHLVSQGYEVWGMMHRNANPQTRELLGEVRMVRGDVLDKKSLTSAIEGAEPDEIYNLADMSYVPHSWRYAELSGRVTGLGPVNVLEAIRLYSDISASRNPGRGQIRFYQASCSEVFGRAPESPQNETSPIQPCTPHGSAKALGHFTTQRYRRDYGMFAVSGILFNHESPRRAAQFVSRKVSLGVAKVKLGQEHHIRLGDLTARRDWGFAGDYVGAMHLMLAQDTPEDYVIGTGVTHSVEDLVSHAFAVAGLNWHDHVVTDTAFIRPAEPENLSADPAKAKKRLGWAPVVAFDDLVTMMVESDLKLLSSTDAKIYQIPDVETSPAHYS